NEPEGRSVVREERLAVHLIGNQELRLGVRCEGQGQRPRERQFVPVRIRKDRLQVIGTVVSALEANLDTVRLRLRLLEHLVQIRTRPASSRDSVVPPWLAGRQRSHLEPSVSGAL